MASGLLLAALSRLRDLGLPHPSVAEVLAASGTSRSRAYEVRAALEQALPALARPAGRPPAAPPAPADTSALSHAVIDHLVRHPGAVVVHETRRHYSDGFRRLVLDLVAAHPDLSLAQVAHAVRVPTATIEDWLTEPANADPPAPPCEAEDRGEADAAGPEVARIATIVEAWRRWRGGFSAFCRHVRHDLLVDWGDTRIGRVLSVHTDRRPARRTGRRADEKALRGAFETFFPGARWTADGSPITLTVCGEAFTFNWELAVDDHSGAFVGADVRDHEDAAAVVAAVQDGVATTGAPPLCLGTDNGTANDGPCVAEALGDTLHVHATPARPQNDAHVEGAFGLFQQTAPPLVVDGATDRERARSVLRLLLTLFARAVNHRPRADRGGRSRVQLYRDETPGPEQVRAARAALEDLLARRAAADRTRRARLDPVTRELLDHTFERHGWQDTTGNLRDAIATYPLDAVLAAVATFDGKAAAGTLPKHAGPRYLLGIARNIATAREGRAIADRLWQLRRHAQDRAILRLEAERDAVTGAHDRPPAVWLDHAIDTHSTIARSFWLRSLADAIRALDPPDRLPAWQTAVRHVHAAYRIHPRERHAILHELAERCLPLP